MSDGTTNSFGYSDSESGISTPNVPRKEPTRSIMVKEIDSVKRQIEHLHLIAPWNETVLGGAIGVVTSAVFGLIGYYQSADAPRWIEIAMIGLLAAGIVAAILCLVFRTSMSDIEAEQKKDIIDELERWKHNGE
ncbi:hypothetical protein [Bifidobacterium sp. SO4]|uniref:hypothetical protein n=1 Tax=Bifidobacterium sp. SO4 TaxID=2809030 RepID=UPI001BDD9CFB|nr:hypothetical protein [Bifidobacterium sp. SO4]MBT1171288.1 hypothetical protein [Bifidobacterium sp. SO4]